MTTRHQLCRSSWSRTKRNFVDHRGVTHRPGVCGRTRSPDGADALDRLGLCLRRHRHRPAATRCGRPRDSGRRIGRYPEHPGGHGHRLRRRRRSGLGNAAAQSISSSSRSSSRNSPASPPSQEQRRLREENADLRAQLRDRYRFDRRHRSQRAIEHVFSSARTRRPDEQHRVIQGETGTGKELIAGPFITRTVQHRGVGAQQAVRDRWPRRNCSDTPRSSPVPCRRGSAGSNSRIAARCSSTKSR